MGDLLKRLRDLATFQHGDCSVADEAVEVIEAMQADVTTLRTELRESWEIRDGLQALAAAMHKIAGAHGLAPPIMDLLADAANGKAVTEQQAMDLVPIDCPNHVARANKAEAELREARERLARVSAIAGNMANNVEADADDRYRLRSLYPHMQPHFERDMVSVRELRAILDGEAEHCAWRNKNAARLRGGAV